MEGRLRKQQFVDGQYVDTIIFGILKDEYFEDRISVNNGKVASDWESHLEADLREPGDLEEKVKEVVAHTFGIEAVNVCADLSPADLKRWDSLGQIRLILALEEAFSIKLTDSDALSVMQVSDIYPIVKRHIG